MPVPSQEHTREGCDDSDFLGGTCERWVSTRQSNRCRCCPPLAGRLCCRPYSTAAGMHTAPKMHCAVFHDSGRPCWPSCACDEYPGGACTDSAGDAYVKRNRLAVERTACRRSGECCLILHHKHQQFHGVSSTPALTSQGAVRFHLIVYARADGAKLCLLQGAQGTGSCADLGSRDGQAEAEKQKPFTRVLAAVRCSSRLTAAVLSAAVTACVHTPCSRQLIQGSPQPQPAA